MLQEVDRAILRAILTNLNMGIKTLTEDRIQQDPGERWAYNAIREDLKKLCTDQILSKNGEQYTIIADIAALREYVLGKAEESGDEEPEQKLKVQDIVGSCWTLKQLPRIAEECEALGEKEMRKRLKALKFAIEKGAISVKSLQTGMGLTYLDACKEISWMEVHDYIESKEGSNFRRVKLDMDGFEKLYGEFDLDKPDDESDDGDDGEENDDDDPFPSLISELYGDNDDDDEEEEEEEEDNDGDGEDEEKVRASQYVRGMLRAPRGDKWYKGRPAPLPKLLYKNERELINDTTEAIVRIAGSDKSMGRNGAIKKVQSYIEAFEILGEEKMVQLYEHVSLELKLMTDYGYAQLKKRLFPDE